MAAWAGGAFQDGPWPTMMHPQAAATLPRPLPSSSIPAGNRFMNEATWVQGKCVGVMVNGGYGPCVVGLRRQLRGRRTLLDSLQYGGGMFWDSLPRRAARTYQVARGIACRSRVEKGGTGQGPRQLQAAPTRSRSWSPMLDVPAGRGPCEPVERYNALCEAGRGHRFLQGGPTTSIPIKQGPFYGLQGWRPACSACAAASTSPTTSRCSTPTTSPVRGLCTPSATAPATSTPTTIPINVQGNSHGRCLIEGKCLGEQLAGVYQEI